LKEIGLITSNTKNQMNLVACYGVFNGIELLEGSIKQILPHVDKVILFWSDQSYFGEPHEVDIDHINDPKIEKVKYDFDIRHDKKSMEREKFNFMIDLCKDQGFSHFLLMAEDHYFDSEQFVKAKEKAVDYDATTVKMFTYYKEPTYQIEPIEPYEAPFIYKIKHNTRFAGNFPVPVDPAVTVIPIESFYSFEQEEIMLHHFSHVREDMECKIRNMACKSNWNNEDELIFNFYNFKIGDKMLFYPDKTIKKVENIFNIQVNGRKRENTRE